MSAVGHLVKRVTNYFANQNLRALGSMLRTSSVLNTANRGYAHRNACTCCTDPPSNIVNLGMDIYDPFIFCNPTFATYYEQLLATLGFGIDVDLGDSPNIIRPYNGSLDDFEVTNRARFAVDQYNKTNNKDIKFEKLVKANILGDKFFLIFDGFVGSREKKRYRAIVDSDHEHNMVLKRFDFYSDADEPLVTYVTVEDEIVPKDYLKYRESLDASEGFDIDHNLNLGGESGYIFPFDGPLDDPKITDAARYAFKEYNRHQKTQLQFVKVVKGTHRTVCSGFFYYLTCEADDCGQKKTLRAKLLLREGKRTKLVSYKLIDENGNVINTFKRCLKSDDLVGDVDRHHF